MKKTAQKNRLKKTKDDGFFQSPLFLGILNFVPLILIILGAVYCGVKLDRQTNKERLVLGAESNYNQGVVISTQDRLRQLTVALEKVDSETIRSEIIRLKNL